MQRAYVIDHLFIRECQIRNKNPDREILTSIPGEHFRYDFVSEAVYHLVVDVLPVECLVTSCFTSISINKFLLLIH